MNCSYCKFCKFYDFNHDLAFFKCKLEDFKIIDDLCNKFIPDPDVVIFREDEESKHIGEWLRTPTYWVYCSVCGEEPPGETNITSKYCPNCGAKMKESSLSDISWSDVWESERIENETKLQMYIKKTEGRPNKYAYGEDWIEQALLIDDIQFDTEEEAIAWWEKYYGRNKSDS